MKKYFLAVDIGNTDVVFGLYDGQQWAYEFRSNSNLSGQFSDYESRLRLNLLENDIKISEVHTGIMSSVVPKLTAVIEQMVQHMFGWQILKINSSLFSKLPISVLQPEQIGSDLVCNAMYAFSKFKNGCIIVDFGTALTTTTINNQGKILGVTIAPGINTAIKSLFSNTAQLPEVPLIVPESVLGTNTVHAIQSGVFWGYIGMVKHVIAKIKEETQINMPVMATGGLSFVLQKYLPEIEAVERKATLEGARLIFEQVNK